MKIIIKDLVIQFDSELFQNGNSKQRAQDALKKAKEILEASGMELKYCQNFDWKVDKSL